MGQHPSLRWWLASIQGHTTFSRPNLTRSCVLLLPDPSISSNMSLVGNKSLEEHDPVLFDLIEQVRD